MYSGRAGEDALKPLSGAAEGGQVGGRGERGEEIDVGGEVEKVGWTRSLLFGRTHWRLAGSAPLRLSILRTGREVGGGSIGRCEQDGVWCLMTAELGCGWRDEGQDWLNRPDIMRSMRPHSCVLTTQERAHNSAAASCSGE